jgi:hypothetical protein
MGTPDAIFIKETRDLSAYIARIRSLQETFEIVLYHAAVRFLANVGRQSADDLVVSGLSELRLGRLAENSQPSDLVCQHEHA